MKLAIHTSLLLLISFSAVAHCGSKTSKKLKARTRSTSHAHDTPSGEAKSTSTRLRAPPRTPPKEKSHLLFTIEALSKFQERANILDTTRESKTSPADRLLRIRLLAFVRRREDPEYEWCGDRQLSDETIRLVQIGHEPVQAGKVVITPDNDLALERVKPRSPESTGTQTEEEILYYDQTNQYPCGPTIRR